MAFCARSILARRCCTDIVSVCGLPNCHICTLSMNEGLLLPSLPFRSACPCLKYTSLRWENPFLSTNHISVILRFEKLLVCFRWTCQFKAHCFVHVLELMKFVCADCFPIWTHFFLNFGVQNLLQLVLPFCTPSSSPLASTNRATLPTLTASGTASRRAISMCVSVWGLQYIVFVD